jgi:hypothetical protein
MKFRTTLMMHFNFMKEKEPWTLQTENSMLLNVFKGKISRDLANYYMNYLRQNRLPDDLISLKEWLKEEYVQATNKEELFAQGATANSLYHRAPRTVKTGINVCDADELQPAAGAGTEGVYAVNEDTTSSDGIDEEQVFALRRQYKNAKAKFQRRRGRSSYSTVERSVARTATSSATSATRGKARSAAGTHQLDQYNCPRCLSNDHWPSKCMTFAQEPEMIRIGLVRKGKICFHCLEGRHLMKDCRKDPSKKCGVQRCLDKHHHMLHRQPYQIKIEDMMSDNEDIPNEDDLCNYVEQMYNTIICCNLGAKHQEVSLQTVVCEVLTNKEPKRVVALLDSGASTSCIDADLAKSLNLKILDGPKTRRMALLNKTTSQQCCYVDLTLTDVDRTQQANIQAWTVQGLTQNSRAVDWSRKKEDFEHLRKLTFPETPRPAKIGILIGNDFLALLQAQEVVRDDHNLYAPIAIRTPLGWTCSGHTTNKKGPRYLVKVKPSMRNSDGDNLYYLSHLRTSGEEEDVGESSE